MLRGEAVENSDNLDFREAGDGNGLGVRARVRVEAAAVQVEQNLVFVGFGQTLGRDNADGNAGHRVFDKRVGAEAGPGDAGAGGIGVSPLAAVLKRLRRALIRRGVADHELRLRTDRLRHGNNAGDVRGALVIDKACVATGGFSSGGWVWLIHRSGLLGG